MLFSLKRSRVKPKAYRLEVDGLAVEVVRKRVKNLNLTVSPPDGRVRVSAPLRLDDDSIRQALSSRMAWIRKHQERLRRHARDLSTPQYVSGERFCVLGETYLLDVVYRQGRPAVERNHTALELYVRPGTSAARREQVLVAWLRRELKAAIGPLVAGWEPLLGLSGTRWAVKRMKTRWGSCNAKAHRIWLNLELALRPAGCLEYVVVHELVHLLEPNHGRGFAARMDRLMPGWQTLRDELNRASPAREARSE